MTSLGTQGRLLREAIEEVEEYCQRSDWLCEIFKFCLSWNENSVEQWRGSSGFLLEVRVVVCLQKQSHPHAALAFKSHQVRM